jgi:hypothetical protein
MRLRVGVLLTLAAPLIGAAACGDDVDTTTCVVQLGAARSSVTFETKVGSSAVATVGRYGVIFSILDGVKLQAEVRDADSTLMTTTTGGSGRAGGSTGTADGQLEFSCAP